MTYVPVAAPSFGGGLNLRDHYEQIQPNQAYDLLNVTFDDRGGIRSRSGFVPFAPSTEATNRYDSMSAFYQTSGTQQLVAGAGNRLEVLDSSGAAVSGGVSTAPTASPHYFVRFGGPTAETLYAANGTDNARKWSGSAWSAPSYTGTAPTGKFLAMTPWDARMVNARRSGSAAGDNASTVFFSDPLLPETFQTYNWVDLTPGDGESIMGVCTYDQYVFVFKETKFFVFYGTSVDSTDGTPMFDYRTIDAGVGLAAAQSLCVAPDGVYFFSTRGIYRTTGGSPELVSALIDPLFNQRVTNLYGGYAINLNSVSSVRMTFYDQQIYVAVPTGSSTVNDRLLVFDPRYGWWSIWDVAASCLASFKTSTFPYLMFGYARGLKRIGRLSNSESADAGYGTITSGSHTLPTATITVASTSDFTQTGKISVGGQTVTYTGITSTTFTGCTGGTGTIATGSAVTQIVVVASVVVTQATTVASRAKFAFSDFGDNASKTIRESKLWGTGTVRFGLGKDFKGSTNAEELVFGSRTDIWADGTVATDTWGIDALYPNDLWRDGGAHTQQITRRAVRAVYLSAEFANSSSAVPAVAWSVNNIVHHVRDHRVPSVIRLDG